MFNQTIKNIKLNKSKRNRKIIEKQTTSTFDNDQLSSKSRKISSIYFICFIYAYLSKILFTLHAIKVGPFCSYPFRSTQGELKEKLVSEKFRNVLRSVEIFCCRSICFVTKLKSSKGKRARRQGKKDSQLAQTQINFLHYQFNRLFL